MKVAAFLRAINVGGRGRVAMADLRRFFAEIGFGGAQTLLQSGNVLLDAEPQSIGTLEELFERQSEARLGLPTEYLVRTADELGRIVDRNPFPRQATEDPSHLLVMFLKSVPLPDGADRVRAAIRGPEKIEVDGRNAYLVYPAGIGESKLTAAVIERELGARGTARNWNTLRKVIDRMAG